MISLDDFTTMVGNNVRKAQDEQVFFEEIFDDPGLAVGSNEFLFFIKPEITLPSKKIQLRKTLSLIYHKIVEFGLQIHSVKILSARYLEQYNIIAQHYGVINQIASSAVKNMPDAAKDRFAELYGHSVDDVRVLGGIEFLDIYSDYDAYSLGTLWQDSDFQKLAGGTYCVPIKVGGEEVFLINGFHPKQLKHFVEPSRSIVVMTLSGDLSWGDARNNFVGSTMPAKANKGSLRNEFLENQMSLGLSDVSPSLNGVHLSAGPVEALVELRRYNSDFSDSASIKEFTDFSFGKQLKQVFDDELVAQITSNVNVDDHGKTVSVFDLTEELDSGEALNVLIEHFQTS